jgi:hypothetical protein
MDLHIDPDARDGGGGRPRVTATPSRGFSEANPDKRGGIRDE